MPQGVKKGRNWDEDGGIWKMKQYEKGAVA